MVLIWGAYFELIRGNTVIFQNLLFLKRSCHDTRLQYYSSKLYNANIHYFKIKFTCFNTERRVSKYGIFSSSYCSTFVLNTDIDSVNPCIHSKYGKLWTNTECIWTRFTQYKIKITYFKAKKYYFENIIYCHRFVKHSHAWLIVEARDGEDHFELFEKFKHFTFVSMKSLEGMVYYSSRQRLCL